MKRVLLVFVALSVLCSAVAQAHLIALLDPDGIVSDDEAAPFIKEVAITIVQPETGTICERGHAAYPGEMSDEKIIAEIQKFATKVSKTYPKGHCFDPAAGLRPKK